METNSKPLSRNRRMAIVFTGLAWLTITVSLMWLPWPPFDLEGWLSQHFPTGHADQYAFVNRLIKPPISLAFVGWLATGIGFLIARRYKLLLVNAIGPVVAMLMVAPTEDWRDPQWFTIGAFIAIGCCVGLFVSIFAWVGSCFKTHSETSSSPLRNESGSGLPQP